MTAKTYPLFEDIIEEDEMDQVSVYGYLPDWIIFGAPMADGKFLVIASTELKYAQLAAHMPKVQQAWEAVQDREHPRAVIVLRAGLKRFVVGYDETYSEAMQAVMKYWSPDAQKPGDELTRPPLMLIESATQMSSAESSSASSPAV